MNVTPAPMPKTKFSRKAALAVARELVTALEPYTERLIVAGSLRRRLPEVGDVEIVFVPKMVEGRLDLFRGVQLQATDQPLQVLLRHGILTKREKKDGTLTWGEKNKLALHVKTGIPVDLFAATEATWFSTLICRTGSARHNIAVASAAQKLGLKWHPYGEGFTDGDGKVIRLTSEPHLFEILGWKWAEPWMR